MTEKARDKALGNNCGATPRRFRWMTAVFCCAALIMLLLCSCSVSGDNGSGNNSDTGWHEDDVRLSESCDYLLCRGIDESGNEYELVANQKESALGYEITVGVIKNNAWIYPLSKDFPFLDQDNLFHVSVSAGDSGTSLKYPNSVIKNIYFLDSGAFLMESYKASGSWLGSSKHSYILFSCDTLSSYTIDCDESTLLFTGYEPRFSDGVVRSYGRIHTANGELLLRTEVSGTHSGWLKDQVFDWIILNTKSLETETLASNVQGLRPESVLADGLIFASDQCFYNKSMQKVIDLSAYDIDMWYANTIYFKDGLCTFTAENDLGTEFLITIDTSGAVISETAK